MTPMITDVLIAQFPERYRPDLLWAKEHKLVPTFDRFEQLEAVLSYMEDNDTPIWNFLEIGVYYGVGSLLFSQFVQPGGSLIGCDNLYSFKANLTPRETDQHRFHISRVYQHIGDVRQINTKFIEISSFDFLRATDRRFNLIHVDANHMLEDFLKDMILAYNLLTQGGILLLDDVRCVEKPVSALGSALGWKLVRDRVSALPVSIDARYGIVRRTDENDAFFKPLIPIASHLRPY